MSDYLSLLERVLCNTIYEDPNFDRWNPKVYNPAARQAGRDWPSKAMTMIGMARLHQLREACENTRADGDFVETGVWRGGALMMMSAASHSRNIDFPLRSRRCVWGFDSFMGLPKPSPEFPDPANDQHHTFSELAVSIQEVRQNFAKCGVPMTGVNLVKGWFRDTIPETAPQIEKIAVLRLDGDMYESTWIALEHLYPKLSPGGYCIVDDFGAVAGCKQAVLDYRTKNNITASIVDIDGLGVYWRK